MKTNPVEMWAVVVNGTNESWIAPESISRTQFGAEQRYCSFNGPDTFWSFNRRVASKSIRLARVIVQEVEE